MGWKCKHCGNKMYAEGEIYTKVKCNIGKDGDIIEKNIDLGKLAIGSLYINRYHCTNCNSSVDFMDELSDIAYWEEE